METNLLLSDIRRGVFVDIEVGMERSVFYMSTEFVERQNARRLAMRLYVRQRSLDIYNSMTSGKVAPIDKYRAVKMEEEKAESFCEDEDVREGYAETWNEKLKRLAVVDLHIKNDRILPHIKEEIKSAEDERIRLLSEWGDWSDENTTQKFRDDYAALSNKYGRLAYIFECLDRRDEAKRYYRKSHRY